MAKTGSRGKATPGKSRDDTKASEASGWGLDAIPDALRDAGKRAADLAQNPYARSLLAAGLVAAAAALASNKNVREVTRRNLRNATEAVEVGADSAGKVGIAIVNAATEAVQRMLSLAGTAADVNDALAGAVAPAKGRGGATAKRTAGAKPAGTPRATPATAKASAAKAAPKKAGARKAGSDGTKAKTPARKPAAARKPKAGA